MPDETGSAPAIARVLVDSGGDREFDYAVPPEMAGKVAQGSRVRIPLQNRQAAGTVTALPPEPPVGKDGRPIRLRPLSRLVHDRPILTPALIELGRWIARYYCTPFEATLNGMIPEAVRSGTGTFKTRKRALLDRPPTDDERSALAKRAPRQAAILADLESAGDEGIALAELAAPAVHALVSRGLAKLVDSVIQRDPFDDIEFVGDTNLTMNAEQQAALDAITGAIVSPGAARPIVLHGVTGSGKTEVYLQAVQHALDLGKSVLVLVPEISLTPQTVDRFKSRFSHMQDQVAVLHSHLSAGERHDEWHKVHRREARIVIGARSAIFAPLEGLGIIIVDEEHEPSYKQDSPPRYHARDIAVVRASIEKCAIVLGSATPSLETYQNSLDGKYARLVLAERADNRNLPLVRIVDLRSESRKQRGGGTAKSRVPSAISEPLRVAIDARLDRGEQVILFLNRRGFATSLVCQVCGHVCECRHCSVPLTFHKADARLVCHICGFRQLAPTKCPAPDCRDPGIRFAGFGTERVEDQLRAAIPRARIARVDTDAMQRKNQLRDTLAAFKSQKLDLLVGTQMIAKGLHFPNVTLVGILNADLGLHIPDFRAGERTFHLPTQVAGRAGRGERKGEVVVQTFTPHSPAVQFARHHDYTGYADQELEFRRGFHFPPFAHAVLITARSVHQRRAEFTLETLHRRLAAHLPPGAIMGDPAPAPLARAQDQWRFQLMLRAPKTATLTRHIRPILDNLTTPTDVIVTMDVDPINLS
ncbi:primosomal protein N' [soil metagenome]